MEKKTSEKKIRKIITLRAPEDEAFLRQSLERSGGRLLKKLPLVGGYVCEFSSETDVSLAVRDEEKRLQVEDDLEFKLCWYPFPFFHPPRIGWGLQRIGAPQVWEKLKERRVRVGIIDTGIDYYHPDLQGNIKSGISTLEGQHQFMDDYGHGTHIAGIIGSSGRNVGMTGINPYVDFYVVKAFNEKGKGNLSDIIEGLDWLARRQVEIINMSFSTTETNSLFQQVIQYLDRQGIVLVAAAGNDGRNNSVNYPARFPQVFAVSAIDKYDSLASFSSRGPEVNFCAPGVEIPSAWLGGRYEVKSGTSFAAPHLTGTIATLFNYYGFLPPGRVREIMFKGAVRLPKLEKEQQGAGLVELPRIIS
ncbi:MAG: S8 family peptidase [Clostridia bacterium]|nr:S8 family peptidase [Clostridia bacterium]